MPIRSRHRPTFTHDPSLMPESKQCPSRFALKYIQQDRYLSLGKFQGWDTLEMTDNPWDAKHFDSAEFAISYKNNEAHVRHVPMWLIELSLETGIKSHGLVPLREPTGWPQWLEENGDSWDYDNDQREEYEKMYAEVYKQHNLTPPGPVNIKFRCPECKETWEVKDLDMNSALNCGLCLVARDKEVPLVAHSATS